MVSEKVCEVCGSDNIEVMAWVCLRSKKLTQMPEKAEIWCNDCCNHVSTKDKDK